MGGTPATARPPCVLFEDEHLLVVNKPAGWNTHAPSPFAGEGIYDWLKHREPRWAGLAIIHRLDKNTSGVMVFAKSPLANRSLTRQFTERRVQKLYLFGTHRLPEWGELRIRSKLSRIGGRYASGNHGEPAETRFQRQGAVKINQRSCFEITATPVTGRTHQIRVHAAENGFPILGDSLYGGEPFPRVCLHAGRLTFLHPATNNEVTFSIPADFRMGVSEGLRRAIVQSEATDAFRLIHGAADGWSGWYVERLGEFVLSQSEEELSAEQRHFLEGLSAKACYHKALKRQVRRTQPSESCPQLVCGEPAPERFTIRENGLRFELSFNEGYSVGLFLDQRDNRRRLLLQHVAAGFELCSQSRNWELLNTFAYTCGFSVCAAAAGARATCLDLSKKYLAWGRRNFQLNQLDPAKHEFILGDAFDWLRRLAKRGRMFDVVMLDPPTFSTSKSTGVFRAEKDCGKLVRLAVPVVKTGGVLFASTNAAQLGPEKFMDVIRREVSRVGRRIVQHHYAPQPPDFPISRDEPAHLKTVWLRIA